MKIYEILWNPPQSDFSLLNLPPPPSLLRKHIYIHIGHMYIHIGHMYIHIGHMYIHIGHMYIHIGHMYIHIGHICPITLSRV
jgi:hypothetical protein